MIGRDNNKQTKRLQQIPETIVRGMKKNTEQER